MVEMAELSEDRERDAELTADESVEEFMLPDASPPEKATKASPEAPDGGWGWVIVAATFGMGITNGAIFVSMSILYIELTEYFQTSKGYTGWIASIFIFSGYTLGPAYGALLQLYGHRKMTIIGGAIFAIGLFISYFAPNVTFLFISCGLVTGIGRGMVRVSNVVVVQEYFNKKRALAAGLSGAGVSVGSLVCGPIVQLLLDTYGLRGTFLFMSAFCLHILPLGGLLRPLANTKNTTKGNTFTAADNMELKSNNNENYADDNESPATETPSKTLTCMFQIRRLFRDALDFSLLKDVKFLLFLISSFLFAAGIGIYIQHTPSRAANLGFNLKLVSLLPTILGASSVVGRLVFSAVGSIRGVNRLLVYAALLLTCGVLHTLYFLCKVPLSVFIHVAIYAFFTGGNMALLPTTLTDMMGVARITKSYSLISVFTGLAMLLGIPLAGFIYDITNNYDIPFYMGGSLEIASAVLVFVVLLLGKRKPKTLIAATKLDK